MLRTIVLLALLASLTASASPGLAAETLPADEAAQATEPSSADATDTGIADTDVQTEATPPPTVELREVNVTATRSERDVLDVPGNVTVIDRETIEKSGVETVPDLLRREAGLYVVNSTSNPEGFQVEARGFNNGGGNGCSTLVMVDGRRVNEMRSSCADWSFIPLENIERIEVVRGPTSSVYGDNAIGGTINVITRHGKAEGLSAELRGRSGGFDTDTGSVFVRGGAGAVSATAFFDDYKTKAYRDEADFRAKRGELGLHFDLGDRGSVAFKGGYATSLRLRPGSLAKELTELDRRQANPGRADDELVVRERFLQSDLKLELTEQIRFVATGYHRRVSENGSLADAFSSFSEDAEGDVLGLNAHFEIDFEIAGLANRVLIGGDLLQEDFDSDSLFSFLGSPSPPSSDRSRRKLWAGFVQSEIDLSEDLTLSLGARRDRARYEGRDRAADATFESRFTVWSPRAALTWRVAEPVSVYASYSRGVRFPNLDETYGFYGFQPGLRPEQSESYEVGAKMRSERVSANLALFTMNVSNEIFFDPSSGMFGSNVNLARTRHRGLELSVSIRPFEWLEMYGTYTYDDVKLTRHPVLEGNRFPLTPRHRGNAGVRVDLPWGFEVGFDARFVGNRFLANDTANALERLPKFAVYDARIAWSRELNEHFEIGLDLVGHNLRDRHVVEFGGISTFSGLVGFFPSPRRHYVAGVRLTARR